MSDEDRIDLTALARERSPDAQIEERTVAALRLAGLLHRPRRAWAVRVAALAAGLVLFIGGFELGRQSRSSQAGGRSTAPSANASVVRQVVWF